MVQRREIPLNVEDAVELLDGEDGVEVQTGDMEYVVYIDWDSAGDVRWVRRALEDIATSVIEDHMAGMDGREHR